MANDYKHEVLNLATAAALHLYEAEASTNVKKHVIASEHIKKALHILKRLDTLVRESEPTK